MTAQDIYLTPRKILGYLCDIEKKIPYIGTFKLYHPSISPIGNITTEQLIQETTLMLEFVGLKGYKADVKYVSLEKGAGGNISLNDSSEKSVHINVSNEYQTNWKATVAVLAHEICHKVLFVNGLYYAPPFTTMNEVFVDLTTIYVGFGQLILDGYITKTQNVTNYLGYLTFDTYKVTHLIVCSVLGNISSETTGLKDTDCFADIAIERWEENSDKSEVLKTYFMKQQRQLAEFHRNVMVLEQILLQCKKDMAYEYDRMDQNFFKLPNRKDGKIGSLMSAFSAIYEFGFYEEDKNLAKLNKAVNDALYGVFVAYQEQKTIELKYDFSCPFCGNTRKNTEVENRSTIMKCLSCGRHYTFNGEHWNVTKRQRELDDERRHRQRIFNEEVNKREQVIRYKAKVEIEDIQNKAEVEIEDIRRNEQQRCKEGILNKIPSYLRWMVARYIK